MRSNASTFRAVARLEDQMMRAAMPRTAAADPIVRIAAFRHETSRPARVWSNGRPVAQLAPLTFALAEVVNG